MSGENAQQNSGLPSQTSADCPLNCWIEFHLVNENGHPVKGITAVFIDSAKKKHNVSFSGQPVTLNNVKPGKGKMVFSSNNLYYSALSEVNITAPYSGTVKYKKEPPTENKISWRGSLMKDVTEPTADGREIGELITKNSYKFIMETIYTEGIIIVGAQHDNNEANKLMFAGQAVRALYPPRITTNSRVVLMFKQQYSPKQITLVRNAVTAAGAKFKEITTLQACLDYINKRDGDNRWKYPILSLRFYSHGGPNQISFGHGIDGTLNLTGNNFTQILPSAFSPSPSTVIYSYACRTGLGQNGTSRDDKRSESLAQKMANHLHVSVWAYIRRSDYVNTWSTAEERQFLIDYGKNLSWQEHAKDIFNGPEHKLTESEKKRLAQLQANMDEWNKNKKQVGALFLEKGAAHGVKAGSTDPAHTAAYLEFSPPPKK